ERYGEILKEQNCKKNAAEGVNLMTMHAAKGLEFDTVFVIEADEGSSPYKKAVTDEEIEEERRLFYVAMTRAKRKLIISYVKEKNGKDMTPSRFVSELLFDV
ncbi:MAG: 3'-5' exonuclease, partial [Dorea sp.]